jgi:hypothetical protein
VAVLVPDAATVKSWPPPAAPSENSPVVPAAALVSGAPGPAGASTIVAKLCDTSDVVALTIGELTDSVTVSCCELIDVAVPVTVAPESSAETCTSWTAVGASPCTGTAPEPVTRSEPDVGTTDCSLAAGAGLAGVAVFSAVGFGVGVGVGSLGAGAADASVCVAAGAELELSGVGAGAEPSCCCATGPGLLTAAAGSG